MTNFYPAFGTEEARTSVSQRTRTLGAKKLRTRTPADLKWLLNERAVVAGELQKGAARIENFTAQIARLHRQLELVEGRMRGALAKQSARQHTLASFDTAIGLAHANVRPDAAGVVNASAGRYGKWGGLTRYLVQTLQEASPEAVSVRDLIKGAIAHFGLVLLIQSERKALNSAIRSSFTDLRKRGLVEPMHELVTGNGGVPGRWRWKPAPTLTDLKAKAERIARETAEKRNAKPNAPISAPANCTADAPANPGSRYPVSICSRSAGKNTS